MSDDGGGGGGGGDDGGGYSDAGDNDYSTNNDNDYSGIGSAFSAFESASEAVSNVESTTAAYNNDSSNYKDDNDYSAIGSTFSTLGNAIDFTSNIESTKSAFDDDDSTTRLQIDDTPSSTTYYNGTSRYNNHVYTPTTTNYIRTNNYRSSSRSDSDQCAGGKVLVAIFGTFCFLLIIVMILNRKSAY